jgi:cell division protein ZapA
VPHVSVTIAGRVYRLACGEGEEERLENLAKLVDSKAAGIKGAFGQIGDQRIAIMAALTLADEVSEANRKLGEAQDELAAMQANRGERPAVTTAETGELAQSLNDAALRIEQIALTLNQASRA